MRCIVREMDIINSKEMKLEETTVTLQSIHPKKPITNNAIRPLEAKGIKTHRNFLKISESVTINITKTPSAKYCRSLFIKLIISEAIIAVPPR